jgi:hypothetical protein
MDTKECLAFFLFAFAAIMRCQQPDQFTSVVASPLTTSTDVFVGTDGKQHVVYELVFTNASPTPATLNKVEVLDAATPAAVLTSYEGRQLISHLRTTGNTAAESARIEFNGTRLLLIDLSLNVSVRLPPRLMHRISLLGAKAPGRRPATPVSLTYVVAPISLSRELATLSPPLAGKGWVAMNGCCEVNGVHRSTSVPVNGRICFAQRFAIDWMRLDDNGRLVHGDASNVHNYTAYDADVLAVADGSVVETLNTLDDQKPGSLPDPKTITIENVDGNHVVLDLGSGRFAFYAHLQKNSVRVKRGDRVKKGQVLGKLGNTGNTSAPHLHFHLMDGPSVLGSNGIPYLLGSFAVAGQIPAEKFAASSGVEGDWGKGAMQPASSRKHQFPMDLAIINFGDGMSVEGAGHGKL